MTDSASSDAGERRPEQRPAPTERRPAPTERRSANGGRPAQKPRLRQAPLDMPRGARAPTSRASRASRSPTTRRPPLDPPRSVRARPRGVPQPTERIARRAPGATPPERGAEPRRPAPPSRRVTRREEEHRQRAPTTRSEAPLRAHAPAPRRAAPTPTPTRRPPPGNSDSEEDLWADVWSEAGASTTGPASEAPGSGAPQADYDGLGSDEWVDGLGPVGALKDPKLPRGFVRGRYEQRAIDPDSLDRPAGYEHTKLNKAKPDASADQPLQRPQGFQRF